MSMDHTGPPIRLDQPVPQTFQLQFGESFVTGLSREAHRGNLAAHALSALLTHSGSNVSEANLRGIAAMAVRAADLLLAELEKGTKP